MQDLLLDDDSLEQQPLFAALYPSIGKRLVAFVLDLLMVAAVLALVDVFLDEVLPVNAARNPFTYPVLLSIPFLKCWMEAKQGATLGKQIMGIVLVHAATKRPIGWKQAFARNLLLLLWIILKVWIDAIWDGYTRSSFFQLEDFIGVDVLEQVLFLVSFLYVLSIFIIIFSPLYRSLSDYFSRTVCMHKKALHSFLE